MQLLLTLIRALHFASTVSLAGSLSFAAFVAEPTFAGHPQAIDTARFRKRLVRLAWASLGLGVVSGALWLILEAQGMSGRSIADVLARGVLGTVLTRTRFGHDWALRALLALPLMACLVALAGRRGTLAKLALWAGL